MQMGNVLILLIPISVHGMMTAKGQEMRLVNSMAWYPDTSQTTTGGGYQRTQQMCSSFVKPPPEGHQCIAVSLRLRIPPHTLKPSMFFVALNRGMENQFTGVES